MQYNLLAMFRVSEAAIEDLRAELAGFKQASGAQWACAAVQLAVAVEALLDEAQLDAQPASSRTRPVDAA